MQKLKDARSEAAKEIEEYKAKKEAEYKKFESEVCDLRLVQIYNGVRHERAGRQASQGRTMGSDSNVKKRADHILQPLFHYTQIYLSRPSPTQTITQTELYPNQ